ncbi:UDP-2,4-diacetamido-2,4,6-trideoxy-beta-L-altropyranose hydrolase [Pantoea trifolii]|uniref:UDP-2,4-diacetamido-2,4, 6-trideoxy-beta-L-altropyranose hydrolase n=1 Tax=Pantoea trifolii TaxID=2968030 RepID=A0ABT1VMB1_9GAMM|nr:MULTISPECIES: UDP-2,4-diacetamido-2,4,6-trideoxy-beta-L-altropyranose hydrolase [unclassified Pantoea]MCQ8228301.1 UDP-2,4-diacetamido-2,4,6-trideoxy-beta-L-altropyranose hydrolase [Pantoea sp. MMK2]MCQ8236474.1 UDP-2,4-diacetamido-2,4,6-trideoxy-beta-L-altropyranose hydrolase [Pantoea sp. MMK3]
MFFGKNVVFRVDASLSIGTGHVMRCLTLADELSKRGAICYFVTRPHPGNAINAIEKRGFRCLILPSNEYAVNDASKGYEDWLGCTQEIDSKETLEILDNITVNLIIIDHYALDIVWESAVKASTTYIAVIDDLANRKHFCNFILDQNAGRSWDDYKLLLPEKCITLFGPGYSLLRDEFSEYRNASINKKERGKLTSILISLGGIDKDNITSEVMDSLSECGLPDECELTIVMGGKSPWIEVVRSNADKLPWNYNLFVDTTEMAKLLSHSDIAIGAAGSSAWERCAMGVPTIMIVVADNQKIIAENLLKSNAAFIINLEENVKNKIIHCFDLIHENPEILEQMSYFSSLLTDGKGAEKVVTELEKLR